METNVREKGFCFDASLTDAELKNVNFFALRYQVVEEKNRFGWTRICIEVRGPLDIIHYGLSIGMAYYDKGLEHRATRLTNSNQAA